MVMLNAIAWAGGRNENTQVIAVALAGATERLGVRSSFLVVAATGLRRWLRQPMLVVLEAVGSDAERFRARKPALAFCC